LGFPGHKTLIQSISQGRVCARWPNCNWNIFGISIKVPTSKRRKKKLENVVPKKNENICAQGKILGLLIIENVI